MYSLVQKLTNSIPEVLLSTLIPKFKFSVAKNADDIVWNLSGVSFPTLGKESNTPTFPISVQAISV